MTLRAVCAAAVLAVRGSALRLESKGHDVANDVANDILQDAAEEQSEHEFRWPTDYTMDETIDLLWYGYDIGHEIQGFIERSPKQHVYINKYKLSEMDIPPTPLPPSLAILSPKDSGVALLMEILQENYLEETKEACGFNEMFVDHDRPWTGHVYCRVYPHGLVMNNSKKMAGAPSFYEAWKKQDTPMDETVILFVVKSPLATLQSWTTSFREKGPCLKRNAAEYDTPCTAIDVTWKDWGNRVRKYEKGLKVDSTVELYNMYMKMYHQIARDGKFKKAMFITYEDLVQDTADVILKISHAMGWKAKGDVLVPQGTKSGNEGPPAPGRPLMVEEMHGRKWLQWTPKAIRDQWCSLLDLPAISDLQENTFGLDEFAVEHYGQDCRSKV